MSILDKIGLSGKLNFDDLYNTFLGMERRQQILVSIGIGVVLIIILFLPVTCVTAKLNEKQLDYDKHLKMASDFYGVINEYKELKKDFGNIRKSVSTSGSDPLKGIIYGVADELNIERQKVTLKTVTSVPGELFTEMAKDVTIKNVRFDQTINLLDKLVTYEAVPVRIKKLTIKADPKNKQNMKQVSLTVSTMKPK